ncbi:MAG: short-chain fatty acyl-CoA regulator family protein [Tabrizicola sp.]|uniref:helix-turn-helix domain-containing protein n=1 Tax=Tabrizicola sp. TaxID=2005166 RepID=UPI002736EABA|nr:XRE family transcriptional regulator [Tabrizicola sp.]MDP3263339.1 short-chain fatty acyl-CoA regulator family protein [Tabrizicola sp.]MDP3646696.1 short-chain fatty acyl-CoA regulator family protein [Paracoccaceae bacterium]MDZ4070052.1 short-chain fatty acyl-CoA regulator family protein [Tabrizicola sp.]
MQKTFIGPHLRRLRLDRNETQGAMARALGISPSYVNLLENNERSVSVQVLLKLFDAYGVDWREIAEEDGSGQLADLRASLQDPLFADARPDLTQLRAALVHAPDLAAAFLRLHRSWQAATDQLLALGEGDVRAINATPETAVHNVFRRQRNHFRDLEEAAEAFWTSPVERDEVYVALKRRLRDGLGISVRLARVEDLPGTLRQYDEARREILLSEALDHTNRTFQLVHMCGLLEQRDLLDTLITRAGIADPRGVARLRVELANYFAAAVLMPYDAFLAEARATKYDLDHIATRFGVSFEQACHRATTLQREGAQGVPFFFMRIDKGGNVTKRFNATDFHLAEYGGACPRLDVHTSFRTPGKIVPQFVEMPDKSQYFVFSRTVDRPTWIRHAQDNRLAVAMGCTIDHAAEIGYAEAFSVAGARMVPIGINCRICPRAHCDQRAHQATILTQPVDEKRRGATRFDG